MTKGRQDQQFVASILLGFPGRWMYSGRKFRSQTAPCKCKSRFTQRTGTCGVTATGEASQG